MACSASGYLLVILFLLVIHLGGAWSNFAIEGSNSLFRFLAYVIGPALIFTGIASRIRQVLMMCQTKCLSLNLTDLTKCPFSSYIRTGIENMNAKNMQNVCTVGGHTLKYRACLRLQGSRGPRRHRGLRWIWQRE